MKQRSNPPRVKKAQAGVRHVPHLSALPAAKAAKKAWSGVRNALLAAEDESTRRQAANRFVRCVLAEAAQAGQVKEMKTEQTNKIPVYRRLADEIKAEILSGKRAPGSVLPSERLMAQQLGVHRNTVAKAYNELEAEELIDARQGVGYLVHAADAARSAKTGQNRSSIARKEPKKKKVNWKARIKDEYQDMEITFDDLFQRFGNKAVISMGSGIASPGIYDKEELARVLSSLIAEEGKTQYFYSPFKGDRMLRQKIVSLLSTKGVHATTGQIQILTETNQALDFVVMLLLKPGDTVIMEEPVSPDAYRAMELAGARIMTVPVDENGMDVDALERLVAEHEPELIYINSSFHDPTGTILSLERRKKVIEISNRWRIPIVEEDAASELVYAGEKLPPIKAFDTEDNIIYIYSFSLTFMPGLSLAFVVADRGLIHSLSYLVSVRMMSVDWLAQKLIAHYLSNGRYYELLEEFRQSYARKQELVCRALDDMKPLGVRYLRPRGGVYIWCQLPDGIDSKAFIREAYQNGLALLPGYVFYPFKNGGRNHIRLNYSFESEERLVEGLTILKSLLMQESKKTTGTQKSIIAGTSKNQTL